MNNRNGLSEMTAAHKANGGDRAKCGTRISGAEYDKKISRLYEDMPQNPTRAQEQTVRELELNLMIDYKLGTGFPQQRRKALLAVHERIEKKRMSLFFNYLLKKVFGKPMNEAAKGLSGFVIQQYASVLSAQELDCFFGTEQVKQPSLPLND